MRRGAFLTEVVAGVEVPDAVVVAIVVNAERVFDGRNGVGMR